MNEVEIIPIEQTKSAALAVIAARRAYTPELLRELPVAHVRIVQRELYKRAQNTPLLRTLKEAVLLCGRFDATRAAHVWQLANAEGMTLEAALDTYAGLTVTVDGVAVCDDRRAVGAAIVFLPAENWILPLLEAAEETRFVKAQQASLAADAERLTLVQALNR